MNLSQSDILVVSSINHKTEAEDLVNGAIGCLKVRM